MNALSHPKPEGTQEAPAERPGYCYAWRLLFVRDGGTKMQDGERFYACKTDAEADAEEYRRRDRKAAKRGEPWASVWGPLTVEVRRVYTVESCARHGTVVAMRAPVHQRAVAMIDQQRAKRIGGRS